MGSFVACWGGLLRSGINDCGGRALGGLKRFDEASAAFQAALTIQPKLADAYYHRAMVSMERSDKAQAKKDLEEALKLTTEPGMRSMVQGLLDELR